MAKTFDPTQIRPLGRSLAPLAGESLSGFVLRLSHRLRVSPDEIIRRTGLADIHDNTQAMAKAAWSTLLPATNGACFASAARLTPTEITALTLAPMAAHYPPIAHTTNHIQAGLQVPRVRGLFAVTSRYCPACLSGDGSSVQKLHGGPWQRVWRLPVFFACPQHKRYLEHLCSACRLPIGTSHYGHLIARPAIPGLHPAQCRHRDRAAKSRPRTAQDLCRGRLDQIELHPTDRPGPELFALQDKIAAMLSPGESAELASEYFTELMLVSALVSIAWPRARPENTSTALTAADQHAAIEDRPHSRALPLDSRASAAFLQTADTLLSADDLRVALTPLAPVENRTRTGIRPTRHRGWDQLFKIYRDACSERFQHAAETLVCSFRRTKSGHRIPLSRVGFGPEHVPAFLLQEWADRHLGAFTGISSRVLRCAAAAYLVRRAQGLGLDEAAQFLGIGTSGKRVGFGSVLGRWIRRQGDLHAFEMAVDAVAADLESAPRIDYRRRRQALATWTLAPEAWNHMLSQLDIRLSSGVIIDDRRRLAVSAYIWARVTQGGFYFSPTPPDVAGDPVAEQAWRQHRADTVNRLKRPDRFRFYSDLKPLLNDHASQLADAIDNDCPPPTCWVAH